MALTEYEKKILEQMEASLREEDPALASQMSAPAAEEETEPARGPRAPRRIALGLTGAVLGMVVLLLGLQLPDILSSSLVAAEADPNVETWMLFTDIILIYAALMLVRFGWLWSMRKLSQRFLKKKPMEFGSWTTRELLIS